MNLIIRSKVRDLYDSDTLINEDYRTQITLEAKKYQCMRHGGFPYKRLLGRLESSRISFGDFARLMKRIEKLRVAHD